MPPTTSMVGGIGLSPGGVVGCGSVVDDDAHGVGPVPAVGPGDDLLHGFGEPFVEVGGDGAGARVVGGVADAVETGQGGNEAGPGHSGEDGPGGVLHFGGQVEVLVCPGVLDEEFPGVAVGVEGGGGDAGCGAEDAGVLLVRGLGRFWLCRLRLGWGWFAGWFGRGHAKRPAT